jgi:hypothetical protein
MNQNINNNNHDPNKNYLKERCLAINKKPIFLAEVYTLLSNNKSIFPGGIKIGEPLTIVCKSRDMFGDKEEMVRWEIPKVINIEWIQSHLVIESRTYMFSTLDFKDIE